MTGTLCAADVDARLRRIALEHDGLLAQLRDTFGLALPDGVRLPLPCHARDQADGTL